VARPVAAACCLLALAAGCAQSGQPFAASTDLPTAPTVPATLPATTPPPTPSAVATTTRPAPRRTPPPPPPPPASTPAPPSCRFITADEMARATGGGTVTVSAPGSTECDYGQQYFDLSTRITVATGPPYTLGTSASAVALDGLGHPARWDPKYTILVVRLPRRDFAVYLTEYAWTANDPAKAKALAIKIYRLAARRLLGS
jgi:hypothetical protein